MALLDAGVSARTADRARQIMALESYLREQERVIPRWVPHVVRDPELYAFSIFGQPGGTAPWAWRAGGHHIGFHVTVIGGDQIATTPFFLGATRPSSATAPATSACAPCPRKRTWRATSSGASPPSARRSRWSARRPPTTS